MVVACVRHMMGGKIERELRAFKTVTSNLLATKIKVPSSSIVGQKQSGVELICCGNDEELATVARGRCLAVAAVGAELRACWSPSASGARHCARGTESGGDLVDLYRGPRLPSV